jgi:hypothetical protein
MRRKALDDAIITQAADLSIRRACGFAGLAIFMVMLGLSYDLALALRMGAELTALLTLGLIFAGWRATRRDLRDSELWMELVANGAAHGIKRAEVSPRLGARLRERLYWHAERVGSLSLLLIGLWAVVRQVSGG